MTHVNVLVQMDAVIRGGVEAGHPLMVEARSAVAELVELGREASKLIKRHGELLEALRKSGRLPKEFGDEAVSLIHARNAMVDTGAYNSRRHGGKFDAALAAFEQQP